MSLIQVILQKTITGVIREEDLPNKGDASLEELAIDSASELWDILEKTGSIVYKDVEFMGMSEADWSCPGCLADLKVTAAAGDISITLANNATTPILEYGALTGPSIECSDSCGHSLPEEEQKARLAKLSQGQSTFLNDV